MSSDIDTNVAPSGAGCAECDQQDGFWVHRALAY